MATYTQFLLGALIFFAALGNTIVATYVMLHRQTPLGRLFGLTILIATFTAWFYIAITFAPAAHNAYTWAKLRFVGVILMLTLAFRIALLYGGHVRWLQLRYFGWFLILPVINIVLVLTNDWHYLFIKVWNVVRVSPINLERITYGAWYPFYLSSQIFFAVVGAVLILHAAINHGGIFRIQAVLMITGAVLGSIFNLPFTFRSTDINAPNLSPIGIFIGTTAFAFAIYRYRFLDIAPITHDIIFQNADDAIFTFDHKERLVMLNSAAIALVNQPSEAIIGKTAQELFPQGTDLIEQLRQNRTLNQVEAGFDESRGKRFYDLRFSTLYQRQRIVGTVVILRDITERKRAEHEREALIEELDTYARSVAHDLKNPLNVILGFTELLAQDTVYSNAQYVEVIQRNAHQMSEIINALLLLAQVRHLNGLDVQPLEMRALVDTVISDLLLVRQVADASIHITDDLPLSMGYLPWVRQVWVNYLSNALKYGGSPPKIEVGGTLEGAMVRYWVRDHGDGLTFEQQTRMFQPFTQLRDNTPNSHGLGLSIVRRIVEKLGGKVGVESELGAGSTFWFTLPRFDL